MGKRVFLITGIAGFVGHHFLEHILKNTDDVVVGIDSLTYSGSLERLRDIEIDPFHHPRFKYLSYDFRQPVGANFAQELQDVTHILHIGAESHVDHSISDPMRFVMANVVGTTNMLELAKMLPKSGNCSCTSQPMKCLARPRCLLTFQRVMIGTVTAKTIRTIQKTHTPRPKALANKW